MVVLHLHLALRYAHPWELIGEDLHCDWVFVGCDACCILPAMFAYGGACNPHKRLYCAVHARAISRVLFDLKGGP